MTDFLGKPVEVGDYVIFKNMNGLKLGIVIVIRAAWDGIPYSVTIQNETHENYVRYSEDIFKISNEEAFRLKMES